MLKQITKKVETRVPEEIYNKLDKIGQYLHMGKTTFARLCIHFSLHSQCIISQGMDYNDLMKMKNNIKGLTINVSEELKNHISIQAKKHKTTESQLIRLYIFRALNQEDKLKENAVNLNFWDYYYHKDI